MLTFASKFLTIPIHDLSSLLIPCDCWCFLEQTFRQIVPPSSANIMLKIQDVLGLKFLHFIPIPKDNSVNLDEYHQ